jgi:hypothetical protein
MILEEELSASLRNLTAGQCFLADRHQLTAPWATLISISTLPRCCPQEQETSLGFWLKGDVMQEISESLCFGDQGRWEGGAVFTLI